MKKSHAWIKFIVVGTELAVLILTGLFIGNKIDNYYGTVPIFTILGIESA